MRAVVATRMMSTCICPRIVESATICIVDLAVVEDVIESVVTQAIVSSVVVSGSAVSSQNGVSKADRVVVDIATTVQRYVPRDSKTKGEILDTSENRQ
jgi:hypothetical protein